MNGNNLLHQILSSFPSSAPFSPLTGKLRETRNLSLDGLAGGSRAILISFLSDSLKVPILLVTSEEEAEFLSQDLASLLSQRIVHYLPLREEVIDSPNSKGSIDFISSEIEELRIRSLHSLRDPDSILLLVTSPKALEEKVILPEVLRIRRGDSFSREDLVRQLAGMGFERVSAVEIHGEMSIRGGILDLFPFQAESPYRIELYDDRVESIRTFNPLTQRSLQSLEDIEILPILEKEESEGTLTLFQHFPRNSLLLQTEGDRVWTLSPPDAPSQEPLLRLHFNMESLPPYFGNLPRFRKDVEKWIEEGITPVLLAENELERDRLHEILSPSSGVKILVGSLRNGFYWGEMGVALITSYELFGRFPRRPKKIHERGIPIEDLLALKPRDYVVHVDYGIGQFEKVEKVVIGAGTPHPYVSDCLLIRYAEGDKILVPVDKMHRVERYVGSSELPPPLTRLGTGYWERVKRRVKSSLREMADELVKLYAIRQAQEGFSFSGDTPLQRELEASFPFEETEDQIKAAEIIKRDMESRRCMDRLVCGEVGYGKTEVALRAAFKAVMDHRQVALLVPTTILAEQHHKTFQDRLERFPLRVEVLSRFKSPREQKENLIDVQNGKVDILIGTHRILSKDLEFNDLGLLIIDEEHRFGVGQKERLKELKKTVDCLSLSATPIPRTLYMSLSGLRDMVTLSTPPQGRLSIHTEISTWDEDLICRAIEREVERGGQVFFIHNRIETLETISQTLKTLLPHITTGISHGQMSVRELENVIFNFLNGRISLLVTTAIIEAGMDFPNANTIIIHRADRFGLAQLHQLRGRVGRSDRKGFCYLLVPKRITEDARKRLSALRSYTELGSGLKLALRDLEIRGAGNLLGPEQHGHIMRVGFDLYCRLLEEAVREIQLGASPLSRGSIPAPSEEREVILHLDEEARIPEDYVEDSYQKVALYKRLLELHDLDGLSELEEEMKDRFGPLPKPCETLIQSVALRILARKVNVQTLTLGDRSVALKFYPHQRLTKKRVENLVQRIPFPIEFFEEDKTGIRFVADPADRMEKARNLLEQILHSFS